MLFGINVGSIYLLTLEKLATDRKTDSPTWYDCTQMPNIKRHETNNVTLWKYVNTNSAEPSDMWQC